MNVLLKIDSYWNLIKIMQIVSSLTITMYRFKSGEVGTVRVRVRVRLGLGLGN